MATAARVLALVFALTACAWFALSVRQAQDTSRATALVSPGKPLSSADARHVRLLLSGAATLNPDLTVDLVRARLAFDQRRYRAAERLAESVARREPMNLEAWSQLLYASARAGDRGRLFRAVRHVSELYPKLR